jgi:hypothetical protein
MLKENVSELKIIVLINADGVVKSLHLQRYIGWPDVRHTACMPSHLANSYALYMKIFT